MDNSVRGVLKPAGQPNSRGSLIVVCLRIDSKAQAEQIRSVDVARVGSLVGRVPFDLMAQIDDAMRLHLEL